MLTMNKPRNRSKGVEGGKGGTSSLQQGNAVNRVVVPNNAIAGEEYK